ncbi:MAG: trigger factor, partial [Muribaculaceae bacterium]|nr:trigger factor [Muribaculaceae bacterium]
SPAYIKAEKEKFNGVKVGDKVVFNPAAACQDSVGELASMLNIDREVAAEVKNDFEMTVTEITHLQPAEHDQEFFDGIFGKDAVKNEEEYTAKVREMIAAQLAPESDYRFGIDARKAIEAAVGEFELPAEFLKRWLVATNEK